MKRQKEEKSIKRTMLTAVLLCWLLPMLLMTGVMARYILGNHYGQAAESYLEQLRFNNQLCVERLNTAVEASREASYDRVINEAWEAYCSGERNAQALYKRCADYLTGKYQRNSAFAFTILWAYEDPESLGCGVYNEAVGGSYEDIRRYWAQDHQRILEAAQGLDTRVGFVPCGEGSRLYLVRNLMNSRYEPLGVLVMGLCRFYCFGNLENLPFADDMCLKINEEIFVETAKSRTEEMEAFVRENPVTGEGSDSKGGNLYLYQKTRGNGYRLCTYLEVGRNAMLMPFYGWQFVFGGMLLGLVPMLCFLLFQFKRQITDPVGELVEGFWRLKKGALGYQLENTSRSREFRYLQESFNEMSAQMERDFHRIYNEELALKDARIMALQSNINPHFLNNTLEIINWEARLGENEKVSKMIGALSTLMDAAMDRRKEAEVPLAKEMEYVQSYLYIIKERFGDRLQVEMRLPEEIMGFLVPRLILQPLIENAIEHGAANRRQGRVAIHGRREGEFLLLEIENDGTLTPEEETHIRRLLAEDYDLSRESSGNLGIANVNQRVRILYGAPCGLTLGKKGKEKVAAVLRIRVSPLGT